MCRKQKSIALWHYLGQSFGFCCCSFWATNPKAQLARAKEQNYRLLHQTHESLHSKGSNLQSEDSSCGAGKRICKPFTLSGINIQSLYGTESTYFIAQKKSTRFLKYSRIWIDISQRQTRSSPASVWTSLSPRKHNENCHEKSSHSC